MSYSNLFSIDHSTAIKAIHKIFNKKDICRIARESKFVCRSTSRLQGWEIFRVLTEKAINPQFSPLSICCEAIEEISPQAKMTVQSLRERINSESCVRFLEKILSEQVITCSRKIYQEMLQKLSPAGRNALQVFSGIKVIDSTEIALNHSLEEHFKGSGGEKNAKACVKICAVCEVTTGLFEKFILADRALPDQGLGMKTLEIVEKGSLNLMDKGFSKLEFYNEIQKRGAYYITPLHANLAVFKEKNDEKPIELAIYIDKKIKKVGFFDEVLFISHQKIPQRIVAFTISEEVKQRKLRYYYQRCKKAKRNPSKENIARQGLAIFLTNVSLEMVPAKLVANLYRVRWQIELIFKSWKSQLGINVLIGKDPNRIKVLLLSRLILISVIAIAISPIKMLLDINEDYELSLPKLINWLKQGSRLSELLFRGARLIQGFLDTCKRWLCKEKKRKRQTTAERVKESINYLYATR